jgi:hypothetical protein
MNEKEYSSVEEIDEVFAAHIESLKMSGIPYDHAGLMAEWVEAVESFKETHVKDYTRL